MRENRTREQKQGNKFVVTDDGPEVKIGEKEKKDL